MAQSSYPAHNEGWYVDIDDAFAESQKTGKPILANFTGSDWCGWCIKLSKAVFEKDEFKTWADDNVVLLELDFPRRKSLPAELQKQNNDLQRAFNVRGFPTVWLFDLIKDQNDQYSIKAYGRTGYTPTVEEFTNSLAQYLAQASKS